MYDGVRLPSLQNKKKLFLSYKIFWLIVLDVDGAESIKAYSLGINNGWMFLLFFCFVISAIPFFFYYSKSVMGIKLYFIMKNFEVIAIPHIRIRF